MPRKKKTLQDPPLIPGTRTCSRCKNHGRRLAIKGHKKYCEYTDCNCYKCYATTERRRLMAQQAAFRRLIPQNIWKKRRWG